MANILIVGCGDIGHALAVELSVKGHAVTGLKRLHATKRTAYTSIQADVTDRGTLQQLGNDFQHLIYIISPDSLTPEAYHAVYQTGLNNTLKTVGPLASVFFISSTRVYAQHKGEWIDESTPTDAKDSQAAILIAAEKTVLAHNKSNTVIRFSGIYGRQKSHLFARLKEGAKVQKSPSLYTNRIHKTDCLGVIVHLLNKKINGDPLHPCYLASDNQPVSAWQLNSHLANQSGFTPPKALLLGKKANQNKRISNLLLLSSGYSFTYPSYLKGYQMSLSNEKI